MLKKICENRLRYRVRYRAEEYRDSIDEERYDRWVKLMDALQQYKCIIYGYSDVTILCEEFAHDEKGRTYYKSFAFYDKNGDNVGRIKLL